MNQENNLSMQAIKAYYDDEGKFVPFEPVRIPKGSHVIVTILDFPILGLPAANKDDAASDTALGSWLNRLYEARAASMNEEMRYIPRSREMRPPINLADNGGQP